MQVKYELKALKRVHCEMNVSFLRGLRSNCFNAFLLKCVRIVQIWQEKANRVTTDASKKKNCEVHESIIKT